MKTKCFVYKKLLFQILPYCMFLLFLLSLNKPIYGEEKFDTNTTKGNLNTDNSIVKWNKIGTLPEGRSVNDYCWCGDSAIMYYHITYQMYDDFRGGIMLYDLKTKKRSWISKDSNTSVAFCNKDGFTAYWYSKDGLMAYDVKTGRKWRTGIYATNYKASICPSLINNTILVVGADRNQLASSLSNNLPGWRILIHKNEYRSLTDPCGNILARDGDYVYYWGKNSSTGETQFSIYDADGRLQRVIDDIPHHVDGSCVIIISGGFYFLDKLNHLIKRTDIKTGESTSYPVPERTQGFDISSKGELIYWIQQKKGSNIWFANKFGDPPFLLKYEGSLPRFSPSGKYLYFHGVGVDILERK